MTLTPVEPHMRCYHLNLYLIPLIPKEKKKEEVLDILLRKAYKTAIVKNQKKVRHPKNRNVNSVASRLEKRRRRRRNEWESRLLGSFL